MTEMSENTRKRIETLRRNYAEQLPVRIEAMEELWASLRGGEGSREGLSELGRQAHGLAGSGATYGFAAVSEKARRLELFLDEMTESGGKPGGGRIREVQLLLQELKDAILAVASPPGASPQ